MTYLSAFLAASRGLGKATRLWSMGLDETRAELRRLVQDRDWAQFHTNENLAKSISIEAAELLELYQWNSDPSGDEVALELADVLTYCLLLSDKLGLDPISIVEAKLEITKGKYPVEKAKGSSAKYDKL